MRALGLSLTLTLLLTGCGESSKLYPASKADGVFFSVPKNWTGLSTAALNKYEKSSSDDETDSRQSLVRWQVASSTLRMGFSARLDQVRTRKVIPKRSKNLMRS